MKIISLTLSALLLGTVLSASAEVELQKGANMVPPPANAGAVSASDQGSTVREGAKKGGHTLRCWQYGRLLYEGSGYRPEVNSPNAVVVHKADGDRTTLFDLKDSVCILSKS